jgi:hypothetical protein
LKNSFLGKSWEKKTKESIKTKKGHFNLIFRFGFLMAEIQSQSKVNLFK